jgi:hypothetical protein
VEQEMHKEYLGEYLGKNKFGRPGRRQEGKVKK